MTETERLLQRQAEWQKTRQALSWPEKIRQAEQWRSTAETFRAERQRRKGQATFPPASKCDATGDTMRLAALAT